MSAPLPHALRTRFQRLIEEGLSGRAAALRLKVSPATGARWAVAIRRTGEARAGPQGRPRGKGKLDPHRPPEVQRQLSEPAVKILQLEKIDNDTLHPCVFHVCVSFTEKGSDTFSGPLTPLSDRSHAARTELSLQPTCAVDFRIMSPIDVVTYLPKCNLSCRSEE